MQKYLHILVYLNNNTYRYMQKYIHILVYLNNNIYRYMQNLYIYQHIYLVLKSTHVIYKYNNNNNNNNNNLNIHNHLKTIVCIIIRMDSFTYYSDFHFSGHFFSGFVCLAALFF